MSRIALSLSICVLLLAGCYPFMGDWRVEVFEQKMFKYERAIRWGYYQQANGFRKIDEPDQDVPDFERLSNFKVSLYQVLSSDFSEDQLRAVQTVEIRYYHVDYLVEKKLIDEQVWEYDEEQKDWFLTGGLPDFK